MKRFMLIVTIMIIGSPIANADTYVIVDSSNTVVSGAIVCDAGTCGNPNSLYSQLTLEQGQRYVLQNKTDANGNDTGVGAQPNQIIKVKEEPERNLFAVITPENVTGFAVDKTQKVYIPDSETNNAGTDTEIVLDDAEIVVEEDLWTYWLKQLQLTWWQFLQWFSS